MLPLLCYVAIPGNVIIMLSEKAELGLSHKACSISNYNIIIYYGFQPNVLVFYCPISDHQNRSAGL